MENLIESNPKIMFGKPVIEGTRITVELILGKIAEGETTEAILSSYPHLTIKFKVSRHGGLSLTEKIDKTILAIREHEAEFENAFTVISEKSVRIRKSF